MFDAYFFYDSDNHLLIQITDMNRNCNAKTEMLLIKCGFFGGIVSCHYQYITILVRNRMSDREQLQ